MRGGGFKVLSILIVVLGLAAATYISSFVEKNRIRLSPDYEDQDLAVEGKKLKGFVLGAEGLLADWYWMTSLQYIGGKLVRSEHGLDSIDDLRPLNPRLLYPYLDNATDLDPKFIAAYSYGAIILPAIDEKQAIALTEKGIAHNPDQWRLYQYLGYIHWRLKNFENAADAYDKGSRIVGAPIFMRMMSAAMKTQGGSRDTARAIYSQMLADASDQQTRDNAQLRLDELDSMDDRDALRTALELFRQRSGRCAVSLAEIFPYLRNARPAHGKGFRVDEAGVIVDPTGYPYVLDTRECRAMLSPHSKLPQA